MLRKGSSVTNIIGIGSTSAGNNATSSTSATSSPYHQPHHHHHHPLRLQQQHYRSSSTSRESHSPSQRYQNIHHQRIASSSTPPTSCTLEGSCVTPTPPKRGSHSQSTGDITVGGGIIGDPRSPLHHHNQSHCCGCSCSTATATNQSSSAAVGTKTSPSKSASESLLRHVVTSSGTSPRAGSPKQQQPLLCSSNHSVVSSNSNNRDCPVDRVTTKHNHNSGTINNKLWLFGSKEEDDEEPFDEDDEGEGDDEDERRGLLVVPPVTSRSRRRVNSVSSGGGGAGLQVGSTASHVYSSGQPNPSPVIVTATVPCQYQYHQNTTVGGGNSPFYNNAAGSAGGAILTSTPIGTNQAGLFKLQSSACSSSNISIPPPNPVVASELLLPMDFIQVLIHQHAKTIVALQDLQREVSTLKDFRTSLLHSLPATGAPPPVPGTNGLLSEAVWNTGGANGGGAVVGSSTSTAHPTPSASTGAGGAAGTSGSSAAPKIPHPDSGFSTETKSTNQKSDAESDDELYSLLSLIQCKVQESIIRNDYLLSSHHTSRTGTAGAQGGEPSSSSRSRRKSDNASGSKPKERLGKLDKVLGNCDKVEFRKDFISRDVIRGVLGAEKTELQRQLFFALVKIENLKSLTKEQKTIDSRVHALSQENEQLRYKLKEMEIELEGTKATLRILQKTSYSPSATLRLPKSSSSSSVLPEAACHLANHPPTHSHHHHHHNQSSNSSSSRLAVPVIPATPTWENDSLDEDNTDFAIPGATTTSVVASSSSASAVGASASAHSSSSSASTATRQRLIQKLSDIESSSSSVVSSPSNNNSTIRLSSSNSSSNNNNNNYSNYGSSNKKSPAPKPPVIIEHTTSTTASPPSSNNNNNNNNNNTTKQQKSASPVGNKSMSSIKSNNSSIPIAVSRLKAGKAAGASPGGGASNSPNATVAKPLSGKMKTGSNNNNPNSGVPGPGGSGGGGGTENGGNGTFWANWFRS